MSVTRKKGPFEKIAGKLRKSIPDTYTQEATKITRRIYYDKGIHQGKLDSEYTPEEIKAIKNIHEITGAASRMGELESIINHQKAIIRKTRKNLQEFLKDQKEQWQEFYNGKGYTKIGIMQLSSNSRVVNQNQNMEDHFGSLRRVPLDFSTLYNFAKAGRQTIEIAEEKYIMEPVSKSRDGKKTTYKIYHKGLFSGLKQDREKSEKRRKEVIAQAKALIAEYEKKDQEEQEAK